MKTLGASALAVLGAAGLGACAQEGGSKQTRVSTPGNMARQLIERMSLEDKIAQLFFVTPEQLFDSDGITRPDQLHHEALQTPAPGGIIFFGQNLQDAEQTRSLLYGLQGFMKDETRIPLFLSVDEEGGEVRRIGANKAFDVPYVPNMSDIGATGDVELACEVARTLSNTVRDLGFNTDFAPSCDIAYSLASAMKWRSFGSDSELVSRMVAAMVTTFNEEGILCCAKHFPGIGDPEGDSHTQSIYSSKTREELSDQLAPFSAAIEAGVPFIMMGHLSLPLITGSDVPASISHAVVQGILRDELGYDGVVLTDSLSMGALSSFCPPEDRGIAAIEAGCDFVLMPPDLKAAYAKLFEAVATRRISEARIDVSLRRILTLKLRAFPEFLEDVAGEVVGDEESAAPVRAK